MNFFIAILMKKFSIGFDEIFLGKLNDGSKNCTIEKSNYLKEGLNVSRCINSCNFTSRSHFYLKR